MQRFTRWLLAILIVGIGTAALPLTAVADTPCNTVVIDNTAQHVLGNSSDLLAAAKRLDNLGADVRIRAFETAPGGSLDDYQRQQVQTCGSWKGPDGLTKGNLVTFMFSMTDHKSLIAYGSNWHASMDINADRIRADYMNAQFKLGNFPQGITNAEAETYQVMNAQLHPRSVPRTVPNQPLPRPYTPKPVVDHSHAWSVFWLIMKFIGGIVAFGILAFVFFRIQQNRKRRAEALAASQQLAITASNSAVDALNNLELQESLKLTVETILTNLNDEDTRAVQEAWSRADSATSAAYARNGSLSDDSSAYDATASHTLEEYEQITSAYSDVNQKAVVASKALAEVEELCTKLQAEIEAAPATLERLKVELAAVKQLDQDMTKQGFRKESAPDFNTADGYLMTADEQVASHDYGMAIGKLEELEELIGRIRSKLEKLARTRDQLISRHLSLGKDLVAAHASVTEANTGLATLKDSYHKACSDDVSKQMDAVDAELNSSQKELDAAASSMSMEFQDWSNASNLLDSVQQRIQRCLVPCKAVAERSHSLLRVSTTATSTVDDLRQLADSVRSSIGNYRGSQHSYASRLDKLETKIGALASDLRKDKPNYMSLEADLIARQAELNQIGSEAKAEHQRVLDEERRAREAEARRLQAIRDAEEAQRRRIREAEQAEERRRQASYTSINISSSSGGFGDSGGSSSGGFGGDSGGSSSGSW